MTDKAKAAAAYRKLAEAAYELADLYTEAAGGVADDLPPLLPGSPPQPQTGDYLHTTSLPDVAIPSEGSLSQCPVHHKPYRDGKYGMFCASKSDGAWSKKGWCSITPQNVDEYLRQVAAA